MLYIHIPYCQTKCIYCNFFSGGNPDWERYFKAVANELSSRIEELKGNSLSSIYFGGGTPSLVPPDVFNTFMKSLNDCLAKNDIKIDDDIEVTLEVNPEDVEEIKIRNWLLNGVNRISMGIQTLGEGELNLINRRHTSAKAIESLRLLKKSFENISVDLIYGIPGQTEESIKGTLDRIISLNPQHISVYSLTYEEGTVLNFLKENKRIKEITEEESLQLNKVIETKLIEEGYERYEVSNYAKDNFRSRHNSGYWNGKHYLGLGPSASSYDGIKTRRTNPANLKNYIKFFENKDIKGSDFYEEEILTTEELIDERIFLSLRTSEGLDLKKFKRDFGEKNYQDLQKALSGWSVSGKMINEDGNVRLTSEGFDISDYIILSIVGKLQD